MPSATSSRKLPADLAPLVPRASRGRNLLLSVLAVLVLLGAALSPAVVRPSLKALSGGGLGVDLSSGILRVGPLDPQVWPSATLLEIEPVPGMTPTRAWVFRAEDVFVDRDWDTEVPSSLPAHEYLEALYPGMVFEPEGNLPARVTRGEGELILAALWTIDDCTQLGDGDQDGASRFSRTESEPELFEPTAVVRSAIGTVSRAPLGDIVSPTSFLSDDVSPWCA